MSAPSTFGAGITPQDADKISRSLVVNNLNIDLQWSEGSFRGFFELHIHAKRIRATYWAMQDISASPPASCLELYD